MERELRILAMSEMAEQAIAGKLALAGDACRMIGSPL